METLIKMYDHLNWANQRILEAFHHTENVNNGVKRLFSHILLSESVWFKRVKNIDHSPLTIWEELSVEDCSELVKQNHENYTKLLSDLSHHNVDTIITYKNSTGNEFTSSIRDILTHVALHGHYHRGQMNQQLRLNGSEPIILDYIHFVR